MTKTQQDSPKKQKDLMNTYINVNQIDEHSL